MNKEDDQVPAGLCLPEGCVDIFPPPVTFFNKAEVWAILEHLSDFFSPDTMFLGKVLNDVLKPDKARDFQDFFLGSGVEQRSKLFRAEIIFPEAGFLLVPRGPSLQAD